MGKADLRELKRALAPKLLSIPGITGVGLPGGNLAVYVEDDSERLRALVKSIVDSIAPGVQIEFHVTGVFRAAPHK